MWKRRCFFLTRNFLEVELDSDGLVCNLKSLMLMGINCDNWGRNLNPLMCIDKGRTEELFNSDT